jgi:AcrR family transcriptional regulator
MGSGVQEGSSFIDAARRAQILGCAIETIAEEGYLQASVVRIARRAGISRGVITYRYPGKDDLVFDVITEIYRVAAGIMLPAVDAEATFAGKLAAYIRSNGVFIDTHRPHAMAVLDIWTSFRTDDGKRLDQVLAAHPVPADMVRLDPEWILRDGQQHGEFAEFPTRSTATALRQAIDGAVLQLSLNPDFDVVGYVEDLVHLFDRATRGDR